MIPRTQAMHSNERCSSVRTFSVFSWNILAPDLEPIQQHSESTKKDDWASDRSPLILQELKSANADILCLQEMQSNCMDRDFVPALQADYEGVRCDNGKNTKMSVPIAVATFWRHEKYSLHCVVHKSRTMITVLRERATPDRYLAVVNVHLEGNPIRVLTRVQQLQSALKTIRNKHDYVNDIVVCGDFNCTPTQSACSSYLLNRHLDGDTEVVENAQTVDCSGIKRHFFDFQPAYPSDLSSRQFFTYSREPGYAAAIDQLWYTCDSVSTVAFRSIFQSKKQRRAILRGSLPNPLGCFRMGRCETQRISCPR